MNLTTPLDSDAGDQLVSTESQSVTGDHGDVHLWTEDASDLLTGWLVISLTHPIRREEQHDREGGGEGMG